MEKELKPVRDVDNDIVTEIEEKIGELELQVIELEAKIIALNLTIAAKDIEIAALKLLVTPVAPTPAPPVPAPISDKARCDNFTKLFSFPAECAYFHGTQDRIPEDVTWEDVPGDNGGVTKWGIDQGGHPNLFESYIKAMTMEQALEIYYAEWCNQGCADLPTPIAEVVHDTFESGGHPIKWLQSILGVAVDGILGPITLAAVKRCARPDVVAKQFLYVRDQYFVSLANEVAHDAQFLTGWLNRDNNLRAFLHLK